ncbi:disintegrin and metalloproteinase domain-containing protein 10-like isoform X2 [Watersipora subatra]|uniref:disintegrin and metalloproteinase domain-containing protein 10-like isoform X2 n=1 Tax=Watersipora subatra TaxID=2589382 RepID=UPI00355B329C
MNKTNKFKMNLVAMSSLTVFVLLTVCSSVYARDNLGEYVKSFSPLFYDSVELHRQHKVTKRSIYDKSINLQLTHDGRKLDLSLHPADDKLFHPHTYISTDGVESEFDTSHFYDGYIRGDPSSSVSGSIINGVFQGIIRTGGQDVYYVDRKEYHPAHSMTKHDQVHSVIYKRTDVNVDKFSERQRVKRGASGDGFCGARIKSIADWMERMEASHLDQISRVKRQTTPSNNVCNLLIQSDPEMWKYFETLFPVADSMVKQEITAFIRQLVREVNGVYAKADFKGKTGYQLRVDRLVINKTCNSNSDHWFCNTNLDVSNFLNLNTYTNHNAYCLAYVLTNRDFADGTLGLAWVAKPDSLSGGICSQYTTYSENGSPRKKSLNTGIVTIKNYGERVPVLMSQITFAHEIGHNFGAEHDATGVGCTPFTDSGDEDGNFIMYYAAISGQRPNNNEFSTCSRNSIGDVLSSPRNTECFKAPTDGHCGNQIVDGQERCDCGYSADCEDSSCCKCCIGQNAANNQLDACTLQLNTSLLAVSCDPSEGPCCRSDCGFYDATVECRPKTECSQQSVCLGTQAECPPSAPEPNGTVCDDETKVCIAGDCTGSVCSKIVGGWKECSQTIQNAADSSFLCMISCKDPVSGTCYSSSDTSNIPQDFKNMLASIGRADGIAVKPGYPCDKDQGFCDYFLTCRQINELGPLARLKGLLLSLTSAEELAAWMQKYWWAVLLAVVGLGFVTFLLVWFGAYFTPSSNPDQPDARDPRKPLTRPERRPDRQRDTMEMR